MHRNTWPGYAFLAVVGGYLVCQYWQTLVMGLALLGVMSLLRGRKR